ncbi:glycosyl transferase family 1 [Galdieria sulphuraria]|uniref:Glycosyl transferase family 1 n=1 Tax=Galdieria sulphuraria TaxID=130081 RepID=M2X549_GALSU|nr:glycosyl transferase family 1 [Galdieria sulphuraria]EME31610.1 glycosyl transferase family 1 [Galdieria sulphuraria]|eukprot:XP_005708130.1 glycosyl transferase family 1 [Galdieria sulphuraria]
MRHFWSSKGAGGTVLKLIFCFLTVFYLTFAFEKSFRSQEEDRKQSIAKPLLSLLWASEFESQTGFGSEAWSFVQGLLSYPVKLRLWHIGTEPWDKKAKVLSDERSNLLQSLWCGKACSSKKVSSEEKVDFLVLHSVPPDWVSPLEKCGLCKAAKFKVGRAMFETTGVPEKWVKLLNDTVDEIWVPSQFHKKTFSSNGVVKRKIRVIPQPIDQESFGKLPIPQRVSLLGDCANRFVFLSIFKWEVRKGVDILLKAYMQEFSERDDVCLILLTRGKGLSANEIKQRVTKFLKKNNIVASNLPRLEVLESSKKDMLNLATLYVSVDAFVLPTRGEGWGRPIMEAMACGTPVIATNWSGQTEYLNAKTGFPIPVEEIVTYSEGPGFAELYKDELEISAASFRNQLWAKPSEQQFRSLMRWVFTNPSAAKKIALQARKEILSKFSPRAVASLVVRRLVELKDASMKVS